MHGRTILGAALLWTATAIAASGDLKAIVDPYIRVQQALSADELDGVKDDARRIAAAAATFESSGESIRSAAAELERAVDLAAARKAFGTLGDAIMIQATEANASLGDDIRVAYCPMARKYWLQRGEKIRNPFYGKAMSECGRISPTMPNGNGR